MNRKFQVNHFLRLKLLYIFDLEIFFIVTEGLGFDLLILILLKAYLSLETIIFSSYFGGFYIYFGNG